MNNSPAPSPLSRRQFLGNSGKIASASALAGITLPVVHGQSGEETKLALVGCGGRGTGAASNALSVSRANGPVKLVAMADVDRGKLDRSYNGLINKHKEQIQVMWALFKSKNIEVKGGFCSVVMKARTVQVPA